MYSIFEGNIYTHYYNSSLFLIEQKQINHEYLIFDIFSIIILKDHTVLNLKLNISHVNVWLMFFLYMNLIYFISIFQNIKFARF